MNLTRLKQALLTATVVLVANSAGAQAPADGAECVRRRARVDVLFREAQAGGAYAARDFEDAARQYVAIWEEYGSAEKGESPGNCGDMAALLETAIRAYDSAGLHHWAARTRLTLVERAPALAGTPQAERAMRDLGPAYLSMFVFERGAAWLERYARAYPASSAAGTHMARAASLRVMLGDAEEAAADAAFLEQLSSSSRDPSLWALVTITLAEFESARDQHEKARARLEGSLAKVDAVGRRDLQVRAYAALGRANQALGRVAQADRAYDRVLVLGADPAALARGIPIDTAAEEFFAPRARRAADALVEARWRRVVREHERRLASKPFPSYAGGVPPQGKGAAHVDRYIDVRVGEWVSKMTASLLAAERDILAVSDGVLEVDTMWLLRARERASAFWLGAVEEASGTKPPAWVSAEPALQRRWDTRLREAVAPLRARGIEQLRACVAGSGPAARGRRAACSEALHKLGVPASSALQGYHWRPTSASGWATDPPMMLDLDGTWYGTTSGEVAR